MSGSSSVAIEGPYYRLVIESPRMIFDNGEGEKEWHDDWVRENEPLVQALKPKLEEYITLLAKGDKQLPKLLQEWGTKLALYAERNPILYAGLEHSYDYTVALRNGAPYRIMVQDVVHTGDEAMLLLCFNEPPPKAVYQAIQTSLRPRLQAAVDAYRASKR